MDDAVKGIIIVICVVIPILIVLLIVWKCCCKNGQFTWPVWPMMDEEAKGILNSESRKRINKHDFLIKRCDQTSTREIENRILERLLRDCRVVECPWNRDLDDGRQPVIVFCVISSRIGTDIENAMKGVHGESRVILVLLHCVLKDLLRGDLSDDEELLDDKMINRMAGIAHFAFSGGEGLYECPQNTAGFNKLVSLLKSLS